MTWIIKRRDNNQTYYLEKNGEVLPIELKRIKDWKGQIAELINRKTFDGTIGYFKYKTEGFSSFLISMPIDLVFVDENRFVIHFESNFQQNKISKVIKGTKFLYVFANGFNKGFDISKGTLIKHYRKIKKGWYE